ncbi:hypothetical protein [uncultured Dokdonia sp.]|uniref:hypothetical protein n=1 Tax=uncultured Dokdonia sp. TaxID=575653 RepID=UPI002636FD49|nr:hypothetical protein [uncultured Dokdonia sp.]
MNILDKMNLADIVLGELKHLKFEQYEDQHVVSLVDLTGFEIIRGYGATMVEAMNDLHSTLF